jgi:hypothetical protein
MKELCKMSLRFLWPHGIPNPHQHRDVIRAYAMGWGDVLTGLWISGTISKAASDRWSEELAAIADPDWLPDESWQWW